MTPLGGSASAAKVLASRLRAIVAKWTFEQVLRGVLVGAAALVGILFASGLLSENLGDRAEELGYVLADLSAMGVSFLASQWLVVGVSNLLFSGSWLLLSGSSKGGWLFWRLLVAFIARQVGHLEALFLWLAIVLSLGDFAYACHFRAVLAVRLTLVALLVGYGVHGVDFLAKRAQKWVGKDATDIDPQVPVRYHGIRRWVLTGLTLLAFVCLCAKARHQAGQLLNLFVAVALGIVLRLGEATVAKKRDAATAYGRQLTEWAKNGDQVIRLLFLLGVPTLLVVSRFPSIRNHESDAVQRSYWRESPPEPPSTEANTVSLFLVSDSQFHEIGGARVGTHLDLVNSVVAVSVRPIELDLLSGATLAHFGKIYAGMLEQRPNMLWAHLGDSADLGCKGEMRRAQAHLRAFGGGAPGRLAALMPGNHDSTFIGNFTWHPDWGTDGVCKSDILWKNNANAMLREVADELRPRQPGTEAIVTDHWSTLWDHRAALAWVTRLGVLEGKSVIGVFLDSSDYTGLGLGVDGVQGSISGAQASEVMSRLDGEPRDSWIVLFMHHPYGEISQVGIHQIKTIARHVGVRQVLGIVSAHTHFAARRIHTIDDEPIPELVVGSTIDPPQEAALLEVTNRGGTKPTIEIRTIPSVRRPGQTCLPRGPGEITSEVCAAIFQSLEGNEQEPSCKELFNELNVPTPGAHFEKPEQLAVAQRKSATRLLKCVFRGRANVTVPENPLVDEWVFPILDAMANESAHEPELVCLSWAASVFQGHKQNGWRYNHALAMSLERAATFGAVEMLSMPLEKGGAVEWTCRPPEVAPPAGVACPACP